MGIGGLAIAGCSNKEYSFDGVIDGEKIKFYEKGLFKTEEHLEVIRRDGTKADYFNIGPGVFAQFVTITSPDGTKRKYGNDKIGQPVMDEARKQCDTYLSKILKINRREGKNLINYN